MCNLCTCYHLSTQSNEPFDRNKKGKKRKKKINDQRGTFDQKKKKKKSHVLISHRWKTRSLIEVEEEQTKRPFFITLHRTQRTTLANSFSSGTNKKILARVYVRYVFLLCFYNCAFSAIRFEHIFTWCIYTHIHTYIHTHTHTNNGNV